MKKATTLFLATSLSLSASATTVNPVPVRKEKAPKGSFFEFILRKNEDDEGDNP